MIRAVIFDCFGVLTTDGWLPFKRKYFSGNPELEQAATDLNKRTDAGLASYDDFVRDIADLAHVPLAEASKAIEHNVTDDELLAYIASDIKPKYKVGLLSNAGANWMDRLFSKEQIALFDAIALSYETGVIKPDARAYQIITERLGVAPDECIFVDDQERYCAAARDAGMKAIWYQSLEQFKADILPLLQVRES